MFMLRLFVTDLQALHIFNVDYPKMYFYLMME
jgi:hypothetical protein